VSCKEDDDAAVEDDADEHIIISLLQFLDRLESRFWTDVNTKACMGRVMNESMIVVMNRRVTIRRGASIGLLVMVDRIRIYSHHDVCTVRVVQYRMCEEASTQLLLVYCVLYVLYVEVKK
jgi:hypothetical protein